MRRRETNYPEEVKQAALAIVAAGGSFRDASEKTGATASAIGYWVGKIRKENGAGLGHSRLIQITVSVPEAKVGGIIADLTGRVESMDFNVVDTIQRRARRSPSTPPLLTDQRPAAEKAAKEPTKKAKTPKGFKMTPERQTVMDLLKKGSMTLQEIADELKLAKDTAKWRVSRLARVKLIKKDDATGKWGIV